MKEYLYGYTSKEKSYEVDNYPWGFRLRTKVRYWLEEKKGFGQRFMKQTLNPKNGEWCKAKAGVYYPLAVMFIDEENGHVEYEAHSYYSGAKSIKEFYEKHEGNLSEEQIENVKFFIARDKVMKDVEFKIECKPYMVSEEEEKKNKEEQEEIKRKIAGAIYGEQKRIII